jgi:prephenate dehydrogenase
MPGEQAKSDFPDKAGRRILRKGSRLSRRKSLTEKELSCVALCGVGLIGGSIGLAMRQARMGAIRLGLDRDAPTRRSALAGEVVDACLARPGKRLGHAGLVILCLPLDQIQPTLRRISSHLSAGCVVTDVTSSKVAVERWARHLLPRHCHFVGSHPLVGSPHKGVQSARGDLLQGGTCIVTRSSATKASAYGLVRRFWSKLGMRVETMKPAEHDRRVAAALYVPGLISAALFEGIRRADGLRLVPPTARQALNVPAGSKPLWEGLVRAHRPGIREALDEVIGLLKSYRRLVSAGDARALTRELEALQHRRQAWMKAD